MLFLYGLEVKMNKSKINKDKKEMLTLSPKIISNEMKSNIKITSGPAI